MLKIIILILTLSVSGCASYQNKKVNIISANGTVSRIQIGTEYYGETPLTVNFNEMTSPRLETCSEFNIYAYPVNPGECLQEKIINGCNIPNTIYFDPRLCPE